MKLYTSYGGSLRFVYVFDNGRRLNASVLSMFATKYGYERGFHKFQNHLRVFL